MISLIAVVPSGNVYDILTFINSINPAIQFICERENFGSLPFLDLMIQRKNDGRLSFGIYSKPTHTGQYLNYFSHHPLSQKKSVASALYNRAFSQWSTEHREDEIKLNDEQLRLNNYPKRFCESIQRKCEEQYSAALIHQRNPSQGNTRKKYIAVPYIRGTSGRMQRALKQHDFIVAHKATNTLRSNICQLKDRLDHQDKNNAVYKIPYQNCNIVYVGETSKCVKDRIMEQKTAVNRKYEQSLIYQHTRQTVHHFDFDNTKVLQQQKSTGPRKIL